MVLAISDPDDMRYDADDDLGLTLRNALSEVRRRRPLVPFDLAERFARARRANVRYEGVSAIAAHGNRAALELLIRLTGEDRDWFRRDVAANAIETLSARLGVSVRREQGKLVVVEPLKA
jgi:hypothetical protein